jgi:hypothetical protein
MALINFVQELAEGDVLRRHPLSRALKQHDARNDKQDYDYPKCKIPEIRIHLRSLLTAPWHSVFDTKSGLQSKSFAELWLS